MTVYLLHFSQPVGSSRHQCQHYIGYASKLNTRLDHHKLRPDVRLMQVLQERGISFALARTWEGGKELERKLKNQKNGGRLCPICNGIKSFQEW